MFFLPFSAHAVGVGVTPSEIEVNVPINQIVEETVIVTNTSDEPGRYSVTPDEYTAYFKVYPSEFDLPPHQEQRVRVQIHGLKGGRFGTNLSVVGMPTDQRVFNAGSGVKVPVRVAVLGGGDSRGWAGGVLAVIIVGIIGLLVWFVHRRDPHVHFFKK
ncbi:MAG: hypothetical protein Q7S89_01365 [bacterium]|nr:hypothetical protein [bacterium]